MTIYKRGDAFPDIYEGGKKTVSLMFRDQMEPDENITSAVWTSVPAGLIFTQAAIAGRVVGATISGGGGGQTYTVICDVETDQGQKITAEKAVFFKAKSG